MCLGAAKSPKIAGEVAKWQPRLIVSAAGHIKTGENRARSLKEARYFGYENSKQQANPFTKQVFHALLTDDLSEWTKSIFSDTCHT